MSSTGHIAKLLGLKADKAKGELASIQAQAADERKKLDHYDELRQVYVPDLKKTHTADELINMDYCRRQLDCAIEQKEKVLVELKEKTVHRQQEVIEAILTKNIAEKIGKQRELEGLYQRARSDDQKALEQHNTATHSKQLIS